MMTQERERQIDTSALLWGVFWRSVLWYTASGVVLGGLYGCAVVAVAMFSIDASEAIEPSEVWAVRATVTFFGVTGFGAGWALARVLGREMRPLLGAVIGAMAGVPLGGFYFLFAYMIALPMGAILGGAYGLAVGIVDAFLVAALTRAFFFPLSEPRLHRRVVVLTSLLGVLIIPAYWFVTLLRSSGYAEFGGMTGSFWGDIFVYAGFPTLVLALVAQWFGGRLSAWYEIAAPRTSATMKEPTLRRALRRGKTRRIAYAALALAVFVVLAAGARAYQSRTILTYIPSREAVLSQDGEKAAALSQGEFAVYGLPEGRRLHTLSLSRAEVPIWTRPCGPPTTGSWRPQTASAYTSTTRRRKRRSRRCPSRPPTGSHGARTSSCWPSRLWRKRITRSPPRARCGYGAGIAGVGCIPFP